MSCIIASLEGSNDTRWIFRGYLQNKTEKTFEVGPTLIWNRPGCAYCAFLEVGSVPDMLFGEATDAGNFDWLLVLVLYNL